MSIFDRIAGANAPDIDTHPTGPWLFDGAIFVHVAYRIEAKIAKEDGIAGTDNLPVTSTAPRLSAMVRALLDRFNPSTGLVAWDGGRTWRHDFDPAYKANRPPKPPGLVALIDAAPRIFEQLGIQSCRVPRYEADDVIASAVYQHDNCVIVSNDKDFFQLFGVRGARQWDPLKRRDTSGLTGDLAKTVLQASETVAAAGTWVTAADVLEKFGVDVGATHPRKVCDVQALIGDAADGVPGCPGIGPVAALEIMRHFHNVAHLTGYISGQDPNIATPGQRDVLAKYGAKLRAGLDKIERSAKLVRLDSSLPVTMHPITRPSTQPGDFLNPLGETLTMAVNPLAALLGAPPTPPPPPPPSLKDQLNAAAQVELPPAPPPPPPAPRVPNAQTTQTIKTAAGQYLAAGHTFEGTVEALQSYQGRIPVDQRLTSIELEDVIGAVFGRDAAPPPPPPVVELPPPPAPPAPAPAPAPTGLLNPPDGVPAHLPATEYAPGGALDPNKKKVKGDVVPDGFGEWSGRTWPSLDKDDSIQFRAVLLAKLSPAQAEQHRTLSTCPAKGAKRTEIQDDAKFLVSILTGEEIQASSETPPVPEAAPPTPTPPPAPAPKPVTISVRELDAKQRAECLRDYAMGRKAGNSRNALRADMVQAFPEVVGLEIEWACAQAMGKITGPIELNNAVHGHTWEADGRAGWDVLGIAEGLFKLCEIDGLTEANIVDRLAGNIPPTPPPAPLPVETLPPMPSAEKFATPTVDVPRPYTTAPTPEAAPPRDGASNLGTVFVDCMPIRDTYVVDLGHLIRRNDWDTQTADELKVSHYLIADFRKGSRGIAAYLSRAIEAGELRGMDIVVMSSASYAPECLEVLEPHASEIVRRVG